MRGQAVQDYVKKKRGLYAADGGEVPDDEEEPETDDEPALEVAPIAPVEAAAPAPDRQQEMKDYLAKKYGEASDDSGIRAAVDDSRQRNMFADIGDGLSQMATARGVANGAQVENHPFQGMRDEGHLGVNRAEDERKQKIQAFVQQNVMGRQMDQDRDRKEGNAAKIKASGDFHTAQLKQNADQFGVRQQDSKDALALNLEDKKRHDKEHNEVMAALNAGRDQQRNDAKSAKDDAYALRTANDDMEKLGKDLDADTTSSRTAIGVAANKVNGARRLMAFADVEPEEIDAAKNDPKAAAALSAKLDKLSPQKKAEMVQGLMSQISNGGGSLGQFEHLNAATAGETMANIKQWLSSSPEAANAGPLLVDNLMTLKNERDASQSVIDSHAAKLKTKHPHAFSHAETKDKAEAMFNQWAAQPVAAPKEKAPVQGGPGMAVGAPAGTTAPSAVMHPQASAAEQWARANPKDPRAKAIMDRLDQADRPAGGQ